MILPLPCLSRGSKPYTAWISRQGGRVASMLYMHQEPGWAWSSSIRLASPSSRSDAGFSDHDWRELLNELLIPSDTSTGCSVHNWLPYASKVGGCWIHSVDDGFGGYQAASRTEGESWMTSRHIRLTRWHRMMSRQSREERIRSNDSYVPKTRSTGEPSVGSKVMVKKFSGDA